MPTKYANLQYRTRSGRLCQLAGLTEDTAKTILAAHAARKVVSFRYGAAVRSLDGAEIESIDLVENLVTPETLLSRPTAPGRSAPSAPNELHD